MMRFLSRPQVNAILILATPVMLVVAESGRGYECEETLFRQAEINQVAETMRGLMRSNPNVPCSDRKKLNLPECVTNWPKPGSELRHSFPIKKLSRSLEYDDAGPYRVLTDLNGKVSTLLIVNEGTWKDCTPALIYPYGDKISYEIDSEADYKNEIDSEAEYKNEIESCIRRFQNNCGFIQNNRAKLRDNCGTIINNCGVIENNYGRVVNNYGIIGKNNVDDRSTSRSRSRGDLSQAESVGTSSRDMFRHYRTWTKSNPRGNSGSHKSSTKISPNFSLQNQGEYGSEHQIGSRRSSNSHNRNSRTSQGSSIQDQRGSRVDPDIDHETSFRRNPGGIRGNYRTSPRTFMEKQGESESESEGEPEISSGTNLII